MNYSSGIYTAILVINLFITILGSWIEPIPGGWKMFSKAERFNLSLIDKDNKKVEIYNYLPSAFYILHEKKFLLVASHICLLNSKDGPYKILDENSHKVLLPTGCKF